MQDVLITKIQTPEDRFKQAVKNKDVVDVHAPQPKRKSTTDISRIVKRKTIKPPKKDVETFTPLVFNLGMSDQWKQHLDSEGYVVIKLNPIASHEDWMSLMQELHSDFDPDNRSTWTNKIMPQNFSKAIQAEHNLCQSKLAWNIRVDPQIRIAFATVHKCLPDDLCVSMDALSISWSCKNKSKLWPHDDQVRGIEGGDKYSVQGAYNTLSVGDENRGLCVVPRSHMSWSDRMDVLKELKLLGKSHFSADGGKSSQYIDTCGPKLKKLLIPEHCLTLWNSRTVHCNSNDLRDRPDLDGKPQMNRLTSFVTWMPKAWRSQEVLRKKLDAYATGRGTSHWAMFCNIKRKPRYPRRTHNLEELNNVTKASKDLIIKHV